MAASSLSLIRSDVSKSAVLNFIPQADRRLLPDRRCTWRGGRRVSDFTRFMEPGLAGDSRQPRPQRQGDVVDAFRH